MGTYEERPLIGLAGAAGAGKDLVADMLVLLYGYRRYALAANIKAEVALTLLAAHDNRFDVCYERDVSSISNYLDEHKRTPPDQPDGWVRGFLQAWAQMRRDLDGADYWIRHPGTAWSSPISLENLRVISDVRYPNEVAAIHANGGRVWRIDRPAYTGDAHARGHIGEQGISRAACDAVIVNNGSVADLKRAVDLAMEPSGTNPLIVASW